MCDTYFGSSNFCPLTTLFREKDKSIQFMLDDLTKDDLLDIINIKEITVQSGL
jgi:hypothetical protein